MFLLLCALIAPASAAPGLQTITLNGHERVYDLESGGLLEVYEDTTGTKGFQDVSAPGADGLFRLEDKISFGYTKSAFWIRFHIKNEGPRGSWILECGNPLIDRIVLFQRSAVGVTVMESGRGIPFYLRPFNHRNMVFPITLETGEERTMCLRFQTESGASFPLKLWGREAFAEKEQSALLLFGFYYGIALVMTLFNLSVYYYIRDKIYLLYVLCVMPYVFAQLCLNGIGYQFLWPGSPWWESKALQVFMSASIVGAMAFTAGFLRMRTVQPSLYRVMMLMCGVGTAGMLLNLFIPTRAGIQLSTIFTSVNILFIFFTAFLIWRKGFRPARTFFLAWSLYLAGVLLHILRAWGVLSANFLTQYSSQIGSGLHIIVLSLALTERINIMREEKDLAQAETLRLNQKLQEHSATLEQKVEERTHELMMAKEAAEEANRVKSDFLSTVSHELRTPLTSVLGFAKIIQGKLERVLLPALPADNAKAAKAAEQVSNNIGIIVMEGERLTKLINDVLDLAKMESGKVEWKDEPVSVKEVIEHSVAATASLFSRSGLSFSAEVQEDLPEIRGDRDRLVQVFINLISNAVKFTEQGGVTCRAVREGDEIVVSLTDTGIGIPPEYHAAIFDKFRQIGDTLTDKPTGTGLGLPICKQIVEHNGGRIWVESGQGKGSSFFFTLPLTRPDTEALRVEALAGHLREHVLTAARSILDSVYTMVETIHQSIGPEKSIGIERLRSMLKDLRIAKTGYIYIFDSNYNMIIHPNPNIEGTNTESRLNPVTGKPILYELIAASRKPDYKHIYKWDKPEDPGNYSYDKIAWVRYFKGFDWYIASSVYVEELYDYHVPTAGHSQQSETQ